MSIEGEVWPVAVVDDNGSLVDVGLFNERARKSSVERGVLWVVHRDTGRVLPYRGEPKLSALEDRGPWTLAQVQTPVNAAGGPGDATPPAVESAAFPESGGRPVGPWQVLADLAATIRDRHRQMPEGSYTTYLFQSGMEKIRKKTAEEAVELVLAQRPPDMVSEAADLLYHLLVLLEAAGVEPEAVQEELRRRE